MKEPSILSIVLAIIENIENEFDDPEKRWEALLNRLSALENKLLEVEE